MTAPETIFAGAAYESRFMVDELRPLGLVAKKIMLIVNKSDGCIEIFPDSRKMRLEEAANGRERRKRAAGTFPKAIIL